MKLFGSGAAAILLAGASIGVAQSASTQSLLGANGKPLEFDVVSIREDKSILDPLKNPIQFGPTPDGYRLKGPLTLTILAAYIPSQGGDSVVFSVDQVAGIPPWLSSSRYVIDAKVSEADLPSWKDPALQPAMLRAMLQAMLADRFKLAVHRETKEESIFELRVGKDGPKFKPSENATLADIRQKHPTAIATFGGTIVASGSTPDQTMYFGMTMAALCAQLSYMAGRPIQDKTGLTGKYDIAYQFEFPPIQPGAGLDALAEINSQIFTILQHQLGLKLVSAKGPVEFLVIDHIEKPSEN